MKIEPLTKQDRGEYLKPGNLTQPFMDDKKLKKLFKVYKQGKDPKIHELELLCRFLHWNRFVETGKWCHFSHDNDFKNEFRFKRNAEEIFESKRFTGCTDCATLFATFARQLGIPTTVLHTIELGWLQDFKQNKEDNAHRGHTFCECFYGDKWILIDPTAEKVIEKYNLPQIDLPYKLGPRYGGSDKYYAYFRGSDLGRRMDTPTHNAWESKCCSEIELKTANTEIGRGEY